MALMAIEVPGHEPVPPDPEALAAQAGLRPLPRVVAPLSSDIIEFHRHVPYHPFTMCGLEAQRKRAESSRKTLRPLRFP
jgi:hypothetical protein